MMHQPIEDDELMAQARWNRCDLRVSWTRLINKAIRQHVRDSAKQRLGLRMAFQKAMYKMAEKETHP